MNLPFRVCSETCGRGAFHPLLLLYVAPIPLPERPPLLVIVRIAVIDTRHFSVGVVENATPTI